jgi:diguanylate cyclase (GGDEF)-like protein
MAGNLASARIELEQRVQQATRELNNLITRIPAGVFKLRMSAEGGYRFDYVSPRWCELLEIDADEVYRNADAALSRLHPEEIAGFSSLFESARQTQAPFRWEGRLKEGLRVKWLHIESTPTRLANDDCVWDGIQYDISANKSREVVLDYIAHYDSLTGLPNRHLLSDRLKQAMIQALRREHLLALVFIDLDGFKQINDRHGHDAGDHFLRVVAARMKHALREGDTLARLGGDEFVAVLIDLPDAAACEPMLKRILEAAASPVVYDDQALLVTASLGVTFYPQAGEIDAAELLHQADLAMYRAKILGKDRFFLFEPQENGAKLQNAASILCK